MIAWLKANPDKGTSGAVGIGGPSDISAFQFRQITGTSFQSVPYRGGGPLLIDLVSGQIDFNFGQASTYIGAVRNGQLKALATQAKERWWGAPEVPTVDEAGVPGLYGSYWHGMWLPKGTPKDVVAKLNAAVMVALADPMVQQRFQGLWPEHLAARAAEPRSAGGLSKSRDRQVVADHQGCGHQSAVTLRQGGLSMRRLVAVALAIVASFSVAQAQSYPSRPITMLVPVPAGGSTDIVGRVVAERMKVSLGQPVVAENVTGAGGATAVARLIAPRPTATRSWSASGRRTSAAR